MRWLVADWSGNKGHIFDAVCQSLRDLGHSTTAVSRSDPAQRERFLSEIRSGNYDRLLTWQRFYRMQKDILAALKDSELQTVFMDFGFVPHYGSVVFDTEGENAASSWLRFWQDGGPEDLSDTDIAAAENLLGQEAARGRLLAKPIAEEFQNLRAPFVFVPLQRPRDSVVRYDSTVHDFGALIRRVLLLAGQAQFVVCKTHPLDRDLDLGVPETIRDRHVIVRRSFGEENDLVCDYLLSKSALVVGVNSNMLFRALLFGTPVIATGAGWYTGSGAYAEVSGVSGLSNLAVAPPDLNAQVRYVATCLSRQLTFEELEDSRKVASLLARLGVLHGPTSQVQSSHA